MKALQLFVLLGKVCFLEFGKSWKKPLDCKNLRICNYCTLASASRQKWSFFSEDNEEESSVYKHALMFKRPSTIDYEEKFTNSVRLIGTVERPLKRINRTDGLFGVHTLLKFKTSSHSSHYSMVLLKMWNQMAEVSINYLKPNDFIYVWGHLYSYDKSWKNGNPELFHEVDVKEINYVAQNDKVPFHQQTKAKDFQSEDDLERKKKRLNLWQVFFANPYEWNDFRKTKTNPKYPDFRHKNTGEVLWISYDDPPWISRQLQFLDSVISGQNREGSMSSKLCSFLPDDDSALKKLKSY